MEVLLGAVYHDEQTGVIGVAVAATYFQFGCARVTLEWIKPDGNIEELTFDRPRLTFQHNASIPDHELLVRSDDKETGERPGGGFLR